MSEDLFNNEKNNKNDQEFIANIDDKIVKNNDKNLIKKIAKLSFEEAMNRLENITEILSSKKNNLEEMIILYEEANYLKDHCEKKLNEAKLKIELINKNN